MGNPIDNMKKNFRKENLDVLYAQMRQGGSVTGEYCKLPKKARLNMYSVSKSVVSAGVGIAIEEGLIDPEEKICDAFPEYVREDMSPNLLDTRVKHMLTMTTGLENALFFADSPERYQVKDWIDYFFRAEFTHRPGERFLYSNFNTYMVSCLIEKRAGQNLLEYLRNRLFEPIGIGNPDWTLCPKGHAHAANGLFLNIDELGNFGEMLLHYGSYNGKRIVPETYLKEATQALVKPGHAGTDENFYGYGYQFWKTPLEGTFMCDGNYGQFCLVMPQKETVVSIISFEKNYGKIKEILLAEAAGL